MSKSLFGKVPQTRPMGIGAQIDMSRPLIENADGSFSTEETITVPRAGKWYNVPTIMGGVRHDPRDVEMWFTSGNPYIQHVGEFDTVDEAVYAARNRTNEIGRLRTPR